MEKLRSSVFEAGSEITRYYQMLPASPLKALYEKFMSLPQAEVDLILDPLVQRGSREQVHPGPCLSKSATLERLDGHESRRDRQFWLDSSRPFG